jgi:hypothetical protein
MTIVRITFEIVIIIRVILFISLVILVVVIRPFIYPAIVLVIIRGSVSIFIGIIRVRLIISAMLVTPVHRFATIGITFAAAIIIKKMLAFPIIVKALYVIKVFGLKHRAVTVSTVPVEFIPLVPFEIISLVALVGAALRTESVPAPVVACISHGFFSWNMKKLCHVIRAYVLEQIAEWMPIPKII